MFQGCIYSTEELFSFAEELCWELNEQAHKSIIIKSAKDFLKSLVYHISSNNGTNGYPIHLRMT